MNAQPSLARDIEVDKAADRRIDAVLALPPNELARFVAQSGVLICEMLSEADWRNRALYAIVERLDGDEFDSDDLRDMVYHIYEIWWCLGDFILQGRGLDWGSDTPRSDECFRLDADAMADLRRRLTRGPKR